MGRAILLCGKDAETPYRFVSPDILVYSLEELCYILKENAFLMEEESLDRRLVQWIETECGLEELAEALYPLVSKKGKISAFVLTVLEYVGFYPEETLEEVRVLLEQGGRLNSYEKIKTRADHMVGSGRYNTALIEYDLLLNKLPAGEKELCARVWHNKGVVLAGLFIFDQAAFCFQKSYEIWPGEETHREYLAAMRMHLGGQEYVSFIAEREGDYETSLELEGRLEQLTRQWEGSHYKKRLELMLEWRENGDKMQYYDEIGEMLRSMKLNYRTNAGD